MQHQLHEHIYWYEYTETLPVIYSCWLLLSHHAGNSIAMC